MVAGAGFTASVWKAVQFVAAIQQHDTYIVMPGLALLILFPSASGAPAQAKLSAAGEAARRTGESVRFDAHGFMGATGNVKM